MNTYTAHAIISVAVLALCTVLFIVGKDSSTQLAAMGFAGTVVGYWLPSPTQQANKS